MSDILAVIQLIAVISGAWFLFAAFANRTGTGLEMGASWRGFFAVNQNYTAKGRFYYRLSALCFLIVAAVAVYHLFA